MGKKLFNLSSGMYLEDAPLVYLHEHFKTHNKKGLKNNWVWFDKKILEDILAAIKELDDVKIMKEGDGVRLYYGIYNKQVCDYLTKIPKKGKDKDRNYSDHIGHNTVFFVPTYKVDGIGECIDNISPTDVIKLRKDYINEQEIPIPASFTGGFDVGHICPPPRSEDGDCTNSGSNL